MVIPRALDATLVLVRHGESTWIVEGRFQGRGDPPLSKLGERQAALVAGRLAERDVPVPLPVPTGPPVAIWHSPLGRAAHTASAIAGAQPTRVPLVAADGLTELAQGEWEGRTRDEIVSRWGTELEAWRSAPVTHHAPGGESLAEAAVRAEHALDSILGTLSKAAADPARIVGNETRDPVPGYPSAAGATPSTDPWAVLVAHDGIFKIVLLTLLDLPLERFWSFPSNLCAIGVVSVHNGIAAMRAHNLTDHLAPLAAELRAAAEVRGDRRGAL
jgi:phosphoserine phosphatase